LDLNQSADKILLAFNHMQKELKREQSLLSQYKIFSSTIAQIQCGHTQIHPTKAVLYEWLHARQSLPIDYYLVGKRLVVNKVLLKDYNLIYENKSDFEKKKKIPTGAEILELDKKTVQEMMIGISKYLSSDENSIDFKYFQAAHLFEFYRHLWKPFTSDSIQVKYVYQSDTTALYLKTGAAPVNTMNARMGANAVYFNETQSDVGNFKILPGKIGYFRFRSFQSGYGKKYDAFLHSSFTRIKSRNIEKLIIDLRGNTGGAMQYTIMKYFVGADVKLGRYVVEKPKKGIENRYLKKFSSDYSKHKRLSRGQKRQMRRGLFEDGLVESDDVDEALIFNGEIIVITDGGTFSSASMLTCHLKTLCNAKILGVTPGGSFYAGNAGTLLAELPYTKFKIYVNPNTFYSHLDKPKDPMKIKIPDFEIDTLIINRDDRDEFYIKAAKRAFN
jgi:C-terminal processing protease CtpA/Prc